LFRSYVHKGEASNHSTVLFDLFDKLSLFKLDYFKVGIEVFEKRLNFGSEDDGPEAVAKLFFSQAAQV
jgi:hypothetical protein